MKVTVNGTKQAELKIVDSRTGVNYVQDFIGNWGAFADGQFIHGEQSGTFACSQDTFDWWVKVLADQQQLDERIAELEDANGSDAVREAIGDAGNTDLECMAAEINNALDMAFSA